LENARQKFPTQGTELTHFESFKSDFPSDKDPHTGIMNSRSGYCSDFDNQTLKHPNKINFLRCESDMKLLFLTPPMENWLRWGTKHVACNPLHAQLADKVGIAAAARVTIEEFYLLAGERCEK
jgi:hypothetical protein